MGVSLAGDVRYGGESCAQALGATRSGAGELGSGDKFLAAATDNARPAPIEARIPPPEKGRPCDYTGWIFLDRLDAMIQRVP